MLERSVKEEMPDHLWRLMSVTECEQEAHREREEIRRQILRDWIPVCRLGPQNLIGRVSK